MKRKNEIERLFNIVSLSETLLSELLMRELINYVYENGHKPQDLSNPCYDEYDIVTEAKVEARLGYGLLQYDVVKIAIANEGMLCILRLNDDEWDDVAALALDDKYDLYIQITNKED